MIRLRVVDVARLALGGALRIESLSAGLMLERPIAMGDQKATLVSMARESGLKRPASAAFATHAATILLHQIRPLMAERSVLVAVCSSTGPASTALTFETTGVSGGWSTADPFWLQNTLPSFSASAIVNALALRGQALGFPGDLAGVYSAFYHSAVSLSANTVQLAVIVAAEDGLEFISAIHGQVTETWKGCAAIVLEKAAMAEDTRLLTVSVQANSYGEIRATAKGHLLVNDVYEALRENAACEHDYSDGGGVIYSSRLGVQ